MSLIRTVKRYHASVSVFKAYTYYDLLKQAITLPFDRYCRDGTSHPPLNIALFVTLRCNARCTICNLEEILNVGDIPDISIENVEKFIDQVKGFKPSIVLFGGEPTIRRDLALIIEMFKRAGMSVGIFTNGSVLNEMKIREYVVAGLDYIVFSLLGHGEVHDQVLNIKGAYVKSIENLKLFLQHRSKTSVVVHSTLTFENIDSFPAMIEELSSLPLAGIRIGHPTFFTKSDIDNHLKFNRTVFPDEDIKPVAQRVAVPAGFADKVVSLYREFKGKVLFIPDIGEKEILNWYSPHFSSKRHCLFTYLGLFVLPNGDVFPCESLNWKMGNIYTDRIADIWNNRKYMQLRRTLKKGLLPACARCCKL